MSRSEQAPSPLAAWTVATVIFLGFVVGGIGVIVGWPVFWAGVGIVAVGLIAGRVVRVMEFTEEFKVREDPARIEPQTTRWHG